jgi:hypothetical protein
MRTEARKLGISMSGEDAKAAAAYTDALTRLYNLFKGITNHIGAALAPELTGLVNWFVKGISPIVEWIDKNKELIVTIGKCVAVIAGVSAGLIGIGVAMLGLSAVIGILGTVAAGVFSAIAVLVTSVGTALAFLLSPIGILIAAVVGISGYFLYEFGVIGDAIEWLKESFGSLFSTAAKAWQGIQDALAAGRLDLVFKVAWTAIKLVWTQGVNFLYSNWLWLQNILLTAWDATVYGLSSLLIKGWAGLESFWFDSIHGIQSAFTMLTKGIIDSWTWAYTQIAKGLAWIYAKLTGMDAVEMVRIVEEDYQTGQKNRNRQYQSDQAAIGQKNLDAHNRISAERNGSLGALQSGYEEKQKARQTGYDKELEDIEQDRINAEQEFNDAVKEAGDVRAQFQADKEIEKTARRAQKETGIIAEKEVKMSANGTFNAAAVQGLQSQGPMDKIARNTEETAKYVKKSYEKKNTATASK